MSSIRLYILSSLADGGDMHGYQLRQIAEKEHVDLWADISPSGLYAAIKRLATEGLIEEVRTEKVGGYPERMVWRITEAGVVTLARLRREGLRKVVLRADPVDIALARLDRANVDEVPELVRERLARLRLMLEEFEAHIRFFQQYLTPLERVVHSHRVHRLRAEIDWHESLLEQLPALLADEAARKDQPRD